MLALFLLFGEKRAAAQQGEFTFKTSVSRVRVDVQVLAEGNIVTDLAQKDFLVYDRNVPQQILSVDRASEPLSLLLLLDISGSMTDYIQQVASVAQQSLKHLRRGDRVGVMIFARTAKVRLPFTDDFSAVEQEIRDAVRDESVGSATEINRAIVAAAKYLDESTETGRKAILILTDNKGLNYQAPDEEAIRELFGADAVLNALVVGRTERPPPIRPGQYVNPDFSHPDVFKIADETGGEAVPVKKADQEFPRMIERIRNRYGLQYRTPIPSQKGFRAIRVELTPDAKLRYPKALLRYRKGYYVK
ncbi:MAG TPA: VWA domain-containing protein [Bryobacteraceae bacterium]|nr:VWA domain-containing protein [Bryobacteraceae bacterium]